MDIVCPRDDKESWGGYLPVADVCQAVLKTGWRGPWSYEVSVRCVGFTHSTMTSTHAQVFYEEDMSKEDADVPAKWAKAAKEAHELLVKQLKEGGS